MRSFHLIVEQGKPKDQIVNKQPTCGVYIWPDLLLKIHPSGSSVCLFVCLLGSLWVLRFLDLDLLFLISPIHLTFCLIYWSVTTQAGAVMNWSQKLMIARGKIFTPFSFPLSQCFSYPNSVKSCSMLWHGAFERLKIGSLKVSILQCPGPAGSLSLAPPACIGLDLCLWFCCWTSKTK